MRLDFEKIKGAIFDIDGTLIDSMPIWQEVGARYLKSIGIEADKGLSDTVYTMTLKEGCCYIRDSYKLTQSAEEIEAGIVDIIKSFYYDEVGLLPGVRELVAELSGRGIPMVLATTGNKDLASHALKRLGLLDSFIDLFACDEYNTGKEESLIFDMARAELEKSAAAPLDKASIYVFEDSVVAVKTAVQNGYTVVGLADKVGMPHWQEIEELADYFYYSMEEAFGTTMRTALSIAGSDSSGGAGIQADIKTMTANGVYAMTAITALTAQNTTGVYAIENVSPEFLGQQLDAVFKDIFPCAVKIGMLSGEAIMRVTAEKLIEYKAEHIVLDPVMVATSGSKLIEEPSVLYMKEKLFKLAEIITPNIPETMTLTGLEIAGKEDMIEAGFCLYEWIKNQKTPEDYTCTKDTAVLIKGGHSINDANDILITKGKCIIIKGERIDNPNTHGTGCTLSSAIAANLAKGYDVETSVRRAKDYISRALKAGLNLGKGSGPLRHMV